LNRPATRTLFAALSPTPPCVTVANGNAGSSATGQTHPYARVRGKTSLATIRFICVFAQPPCRYDSQKSFDSDSGKPRGTTPSGTRSGRPAQPGRCSRRAGLRAGEPRLVARGV